MILYRIAKKEFIQDLSGMGALLHGGRWNMKGVRAMYASQSLSLAILEIIANLGADQIDTGLYLAELEFPDELAIQTIDKLPQNWNAFPYSYHTVEQGTKFLKSGGLCLEIPSAIVTSEYNYLLNPKHEAHSKIRILDTRPLILDKRIL